MKNENITPDQWFDFIKKKIKQEWLLKDTENKVMINSVNEVLKGRKVILNRTESRT